MAARRAGEALGVNRDTGLLLGAIIVIAAGEETWMRFLPKYLAVLGAGVFVIGLFDALKTLLGALYAYPGGILADRWGHRRSLLFFTSLSIAGYVLVLALPYWPAVLVAMFLFLAWTNLSLPATFTLVGASLPANRHATGIAVQSLVRRLPVLVGPIAGGLLLDRFGVVDGVRVGVVVSIAFGGLALLLHGRLREAEKVLPTERQRFVAGVRNFSPDLKRLLASDILIRFCERIPFAWVVIYSMDHVGITAAQFGLLVALEMATAIACYLPAARLADRYGREPFVIATFGFFTLFPVALAWSSSLAGLAVAFVIRGLKEFGEPARKALIVGLAPPSGRAQAIGSYYLLRDVVATSGALAGAVLWRIGPRFNFWAAFAVGALGTLAYVAMRARPSSQ